MSALQVIIKREQGLYSARMYKQDSVIGKYTSGQHGIITGETDLDTLLKKVHTFFKETKEGQE